jgi:SNF2 family DNA or RNA helicase
VLVDVRGIPRERRLAAADRIRVLPTFDLPRLDWFNHDPCPRHTDLDHGLAQVPPCRRCGIRLRHHQKVGIAWLYMRGKGLIADQVGMGKTGIAAGLFALQKQAGELNGSRALVVCKGSATGQWVVELNRFLPRLAITSSAGPRPRRIETYLSTWDILVIGQQMYNQDADLLAQVGVTTLVIDDVDPLRNPTNRTAYHLKTQARACERVAVLTGTPLQKRLPELYSILEPLGGFDIFGSMTRFKAMYLREELVKLYSPQAGRMVLTKKTVGYKNLADFKVKVAPLVLRRTPADIDDVDLPTIIAHNVYLDLHPAQRARYDELRRGVLRIIRRHATSVKRAAAMAQFTYGQQICAGLSSLGETDGPGSSVKLDWVQRQVVDGDLCEDKTVVFCRFTATVAALTDRLARHQVGHGVIWGRDRDRASRTATLDRFWDDPGCRVLVGTEAMEASLNLQCARYLINVDQLMNPARMTQLAGRIRRDGSAYRSVYVVNLFARNTQEDGYLDLLEREQALADYVWDEASALYDALSPLALLQLIGGRS